MPNASASRPRKSPLRAPSGCEPGPTRTSSRSGKRRSPPTRSRRAPCTRGWPRRRSRGLHSLRHGHAQPVLRGLPLLPRPDRHEHEAAQPPAPVHLARAAVRAPHPYTDARRPATSPTGGAGGGPLRSNSAARTAATWGSGV